MSWKRTGARYTCGRYLISRATEGGGLVRFTLWDRITGARLASWPYLAEAMEAAERMGA